MSPPPDAKHWIQTYTGLKFYPLAPGAEDVCVEDIAHALSNICRYTGHVEHFYSVGEHSVRVGRRVLELTGDYKLALWGLLHDASEAYLTDIARPVKRQPAMELYRKAEAELQLVIMHAFGLSTVEPAVVRQVDNEMLWSEAPRLFKGGLHPDWAQTAEPVETIALRGLGYTPQMAEFAFLLDFYRYSAKCGR
jgi:hypothetical protein